ncbi:MAG: MarR family winged helix-turn-helix transcriptional regulator [Candidatus Limnocylindria bacterium]
MSTAREPRFALLGHMRSIELAVHREMLRRIRDAGYEGLGIPHVAFMAHMTVEGRRLGEFAELMQVTISAASQLATSLERLGLVERVADSRDGRAVLVRATGRADAGFRAARERLAEIEDEWVKVVGAGGLERLDRTLAKMAGVRRATSTPRPKKARPRSVEAEGHGREGRTA